MMPIAVHNILSMSNHVAASPRETSPPVLIWLCACASVRCRYTDIVLKKIWKGEKNYSCYLVLDKSKLTND